MKVIPVAYTAFNDFKAKDAGYVRHLDYDPNILVTEIDELAEFAGRLCYQSWNRPNPATATNEGYLDNILNQGHYSVLEHASISFYVEGVSRSLSHELIRHRHLSFSEISQRYVNMEEAQFITPPDLFELLKEEDPGITWEQANANFRADDAGKAIIRSYNSIHARLARWGLKGKKARQAARAVMPNCTETKFIVTGNVRAWRDVLGKRWHGAADTEIQLFAGQVLDHLRQFAPNSVQDIPLEPYS